VKRLDGESAIPSKHVAVDVCDGVTAGVIGSLTNNYGNKLGTVTV
jgi:hypothetical protein